MGRCYDLPMEFEFTEAQAKDITELVTLINSAYRGEESKKGWTTEADLLDGQRIDAFTLKSLIERDGSTVLVATEVDADKILGCVHLQKDGSSCHLGLLTVTPSLQRKGLGKQLLEESEAFAQFWDCDEISMSVIEQRQELISWYEEKGFKKTGETKPFPYGDERFGLPRREDLRFIILRKKISL